MGKGKVTLRERSAKNAERYFHNYDALAIDRRSQKQLDLYVQLAYRDGYRAAQRDLRKAKGPTAWARAVNELDKADPANAPRRKVAKNPPISKPHGAASKPLEGICDACDLGLSVARRFHGLDCPKRKAAKVAK